MTRKIFKLSIKKKSYIFYWGGSGDLQWTDCSPIFSCSLEDQYQTEKFTKVFNFRQWDSFSQSYVLKPFMHDLRNMTQLNFITKVQKPLRRCLLSKPLDEPPTTKHDPIFPSITSSSSRHSGEEDGTAEPAESSATTAADSIQLPGSTATDAAGTAAAEGNTAVAVRSFSFRLSDAAMKKVLELQDVLQLNESGVAVTEVAAP